MSQAIEKRLQMIVRQRVKELAIVVSVVIGIEYLIHWIFASQYVAILSKFHNEVLFNTSYDDFIRNTIQMVINGYY